MLYYPTSHNHYTFLCSQGMHFSDTFVQNSLLHFYVTQVDIVFATWVFDSIPNPDVVSWTSMISGLNKCRFVEEAIVKFMSMDVPPNSTTLVIVMSACSSLGALNVGFLHEMWVFVKLFQEMVQGKEVEPNEDTIVNVLSACSSIGALSLGQWVNSYISARPDLVLNGILGNALINMYVKYGEVGMAVSSIISGMAMNGYGIHTLQLFSLMLVHGIPLDDVTFLGLLSTCSHACLVDQGLMIFNAMKNVYRIALQTLHYACLVDMYGRARFLEEAENFMKEMPTEADGVVWGALLNACKIHGNEKMLKRIRNGLLKSRGVGIGTYALVSNTYATHERWDEANKVRDEMRQMRLKKLAAYSQIYVDPNTLTFF
ncbi:unnamed protein product [Malus baccata var. baccata]